MDILKADEFRELVEESLKGSGVDCAAVRANARRSTLLNQELFFDLKRTASAHVPDLLLTSERIPCELKSPEEIYIACRSSRAHFFSYLLQTIYGQCFSYADLFRPDGDLLSIFLVIPKTVRPDVVSFQNIEDLFSNITRADWPCYRRQMSLASVRFESPAFATSSVTGLYGTMGTDAALLTTKISYEPNHRMQPAPAEAPDR
jgi:hypothetical protein